MTKGKGFLDGVFNRFGVPAPMSTFPTLVIPRKAGFQFFEGKGRPKVAVGNLRRDAKRLRRRKHLQGLRRRKD